MTQKDYPLATNHTIKDEQAEAVKQLQQMRQLEKLAQSFAAGYPNMGGAPLPHLTGKALSLEDLEDAMEAVSGVTYSGEYRFFVAKDGTTIAEKVAVDPAAEAPMRFYRTDKGWVKSGDPKKKLVTKRCTEHLNNQFEAYILKETVT